eukprot:TRINITY_DN7120_c0_g2_i5.p1 TRINITY_DN7120_c0_g2~~TRINITY_DN7120_c0_g2_i5.p1  ORF type:complete len:162 (+),score=36.91 TRINITY_DN7120_c0_g2_i5:126-611(+)
MIRRPPRSPLSSSSAASDVYKRQEHSLALIQMGRFLNLVTSNMQHAANQTDKYKMRVFMGHEFTIGSLLVIMGAPLRACVPWGAHIQLQMLQPVQRGGPHSPDQLVVRVLFDGRAISLQGCPELCPWLKFEQLMGQVVRNATGYISTYCNQSLITPPQPKC